VISYDVLVAMTEGLGIPTERMGLSWWGPDGVWYGPEGAYPEGVTIANIPKGVSAGMLRRHLIALGGIVMAGAPVAKLGELLTDLGGLDPVAPPSQLSGIHVMRVRDLTPAWGIPADDQRAVVVGARGRAAVEACALADSATALALLGKHDAAGTELAKGRDLWTPIRTDPFGDLDRPAARLALARGRLDLAEQLAAASMRRWEGGSLISRTHSGIVLATVHVTAGEPRGLRLAHDAITNVTKLSSARARRCIEPLAAALEAQPGSDARELARMARQVAA
jgi:hypothetical protein